MQKKWLGFFSLLPSQCLLFMDQTILSVALPTIQTQMQASNNALQWTINAYLLFIAMTAPIGGKIGDLLGARKAYLSGLFLFLFASIGCALSHTIINLIIGRALQGIGSAIMIPTQMALFSQLFPSKERGRAVGINASLSSLFLILGPLIGGFLTEYSSWNMIFWINVPIVLLGMGLTLRFLPASSSIKGKIPWMNALIFASFAASLTLFFMQEKVYGLFSMEEGLIFLWFLFSLIGFIWLEKKTIQPFLDLSLLKHRVYASINLNIFITSFVLSVTIFRTIYLQTALGYSASWAGTLSFISTIPVFFASPLGGYLADHIGEKIPIVLGYLMQIASFFWLGFYPTLSVYPLLLAFCLYSFGVSFIFTPSYSTGMKVVPPQKLGVSFGLMATQRALASTMGVALIGLVWNAVQTKVLLHGASSIEAQAAGFSFTHFSLGFLMLGFFALTFLIHQSPKQ